MGFPMDTAWLVGYVRTALVVKLHLSSLRRLLTAIVRWTHCTAIRESMALLLDRTSPRIASVHSPVDSWERSHRALGRQELNYVKSLPTGSAEVLKREEPEVYEVRNVCVDGSMGQIYCGTENLVPGLSQVELPYAPLRSSPTGRIQVFGRVVGRPLARPVAHIEEAAFAVTRWPGTWYHFVLETLAPIVILRELGILNKMPILIDHRAAHIPSMSEALQALAPRANLIPVPSLGCISVSNLWVPSPPTVHLPSLKQRGPGSNGRTIPSYQVEAMSMLRKTFRKLNCLNQPSSTPKRRIFLERSFNLKDPRPVVSHQRLELIQNLGLEPIDVGNQSFHQQLELFRSSEVVVGATGSAWVNLLMLESGARGIVIGPREPSVPSIWSPLAQISEARIEYVPADWRFDWQKGYRKLVADERLLRTAVDELECSEMPHHNRTYWER